MYLDPEVSGGEVVSSVMIGAFAEGVRLAARA
jgi:hypothetical protein